MIKLRGEDLDGDLLDFSLMMIESTYPDDDVIYVRTSIGSIPVRASTVYVHPEYFSDIAEVAQLQRAADAPRR